MRSIFARMLPARRGAALIVSIGVLTILAVMALLFATTTKVESVAASNYVDMVRAKILAQSGIEAAVGRLTSLAGTKSWDGLRDEWAFGVYDPINPNSFPPNETASTPLDRSKAPSFCIRVAGPNSLPLQLTVDGVQVGCSGILPGTYEINGDHYSVKVVDSGSKLNLNGEEPNLPTMLNNLGTAIQQWMSQNAALYAPPYYGTALSPYNPIGGAGPSLVTARNAKPGRRFATIEEVLPLLPAAPPGVSPPDHAALVRSFMTVYGWVDRGVLKPKPGNPFNWMGGPINQDFSYTLTDPVPGSNPPVVSGRPPVNINTASVPVLTCVLAGLQAVVMANGVPTQTGQLSGGGVLNGQYSAVLTQAISFNEAWQIALRIDDYRRKRTVGTGPSQGPVPFTNWTQFNSFVNGDGNEDGVVDPAPSPGGPAVGIPASVFSPSTQAIYHRGVIQAMANPNTDFEKFNPSRAMTRSAITGANLTAAVDKSDLTYFTTEFCFNSLGYYEIESLGRVTARGGRLVAAHQVRCAVKLYDQVRLTSQRDFLANKSGAGFQRTVTYPENVRNRSTTTDENSANALMGSTLDGQVSLKDRLVTTGSLWNAGLDDKVQGSDNFTRPNPYPGMAYKCLHGISMFNPSGQGTLYLSGGDVARCSDLFSDGLFVGTSRNRLPSWSYSPTGPTSVPPGSAPGNLMPNNGRVGYWCKPVAGTGGKLAGVASVLLLGKFMGTFGPSWMMPADIYGIFMTKDWINGGHCSRVSGGYILPNASFRNDLAYPFARDYFILQSPFPWNSSMGMSDWHYIEFSWTNYYQPWAVRIDGQVVASVPGYIVGPGSYVYLNTTRIIDDMQIAQVFLPAYWGSVWKWMTEGTFDNLTTYIDSASGAPPYRYDPTAGGSTYQGTLPWPAGVPASVRVLGLTFSQSRPKYRADGTVLPATARPYIQVTATVNGTNYDCGSVGDGTNGLGGVPLPVSQGGNLLPINAAASTGSPVSYRASFYDNGITPANIAPYLDDVTLTYTSGPDFLFYCEGE